MKSERAFGAQSEVNSMLLPLSPHMLFVSLYLRRVAKRGTIHELNHSSSTEKLACTRKALRSLTFCTFVRRFNAAHNDTHNISLGLSEHYKAMNPGRWTFTAMSSTITVLIWRQHRHVLRCAVLHRLKNFEGRCRRQKH